ncbi:MAG: glycoside hydrolase family 57 protein [Candidatus Nezhaarchaeales archaeon]
MVNSVVFLFELHQPIRLRPCSAQCVRDRLLKGIDAIYDWQLNEEVFKRVSSKCYWPALNIISKALKEYDFKLSLSMSGVWIDQALKFSPKLIDLVSRIVDSGKVELVAQTYYHSVSPLLSDLEELREQVEESRKILWDIFGFQAKTAEATELIYNNDIGRLFWSMGFKSCVTEGVERILAWRSPNYVYSAYGCDLKLLLRNYRLSDDVAFRFSNVRWDQYPLTADKYANWIAACPGDLVFIAMDFETFGEHHHPETGILEFLKWLPWELAAKGVKTLTVSEATDKYRSMGVYDVPPWDTISWADVEKDLSAWAGSDLQRKALELYEELGMYAKAVGGEYLRHWRSMGISDNFYYMSSKRGPSGEVHTYFSPFKEPLNAYTSYLSLLTLLYEEVLERYLEKVERYAWKVKTTQKHAFAFTWSGKEIYRARCLSDVLQALKTVGKEVAEESIVRGYLQRWIRYVLLWEELAESIDRAVEEDKATCLKATIKMLEDAKSSL